MHNSYYTCIYSVHNRSAFNFTFSRQGIPILCKYGILYSQKCFERDKHLLFCADTPKQQSIEDNDPRFIILPSDIPLKFLVHGKVNVAEVEQLGVSRPIYVNVDSPHLGFPYFK